MLFENFLKRRIMGIILVLILFLILLVTGCDKQDYKGSTLLKLLTYNIHYGANADNIFDIDATADTIRNSGADIIALQEVDRFWGRRSRFCDEARYLALKLSMHYVFGATLDRDILFPGAGEFGIMILSKYKIINSVFHLLPSVFEQRGVLVCSIQTPDGVIPVACTHLGLAVSDRENQIAGIIALLSGQENVLLLGDFNTDPWAGELNPLKNQYTDLQAVYGLDSVGTFLYKGVWERIDYIFAANQWRPNYCRVLPDQSSDHLAVYIEVKPVDSI